MFLKPLEQVDKTTSKLCDHNQQFPNSFLWNHRVNCLWQNIWSARKNSKQLAMKSPCYLHTQLAIWSSLITYLQQQARLQHNPYRKSSSLNSEIQKGIDLYSNELILSPPCYYLPLFLDHTSHLQQTNLRNVVKLA